MKVLLVRSPRHYWPFINEYDNFLLPQSLVCLGAAVRQAGHNVKIIDCMPLKMGWNSLRRVMEEEKPDAVGVGDSESLYSHEVLRVFSMAKEINPRTVTVAGGAHFSNIPEESLLENSQLDYIVRGEGETAFVNLLKEHEKTKPDFSQVLGVSYKPNGSVIHNMPQPLIKSLDDLPMPAYDLVPMSEYGKARYLFDPGGITVHHSRGCADSCDFCVWWVQMSERTMKDGKETFSPKWRTKGVDKMMDELDVLVNKYGRRGFVFVDDSWNMSSKWGDAFADAVLKRGLNFNWFAFMRADCMLKDEKNGVMEKLVRAGLKHCCIGVERASSKDLSHMNKEFYSTDLVKECLHMLRDKHPQVFRQVTFIVGIREESRESMLSQVDYARELCADYPGFHPMTPVPGTKEWREAKEKGYLELTDYKYYDWFTPVMSSKYLSRQEIEDLMYVINKKFTTPWWLLKGLFSRFPYKRKMYLWWTLVMARVLWQNIKKFTFPKKFMDLAGLVKPAWYDE